MSDSPTVISHEGFSLGDYDIVRPLGHGGMGTVYLGKPKGKDTLVALKTLRATDERALHRFKREYRVLSQCDHPNIVKILDFYTTTTLSVLVMEYVEGKTLGDMIMASKGPWTEEEQATKAMRRMLKMMLQVCRALGYIHGRRIIHRDLKPTNIMVTPQGRVVLLDFGLGKEMDMSGTHTEDGAIIGSINYMAPEQIKNIRNIDARADLFPIGAIMYFWCSGALPFASPDFTGVLMNVLFEDPSPIRKVSPYVPETLDQTIMQLLEKDAAARYQSAEMIRQDLAAILESLANLGQPLSRTSLAVLNTLQDEADHPLLESHFVGRSPELDILKTALEATTSGKGSSILVTGETGIGKSHLLKEAQVFAKAKGCRVYEGRFFEHDRLPLLVFRDVLTRVAHRAQGIPKLWKNLCEKDPGVTQLGLLDDSSIHDTFARGPQKVLNEEKQAFFLSAGNLLAALAQENPLVIVLEDLHWADQPSLELIQYLAGVFLDQNPVPITFVLSTRSEEPEVAVFHTLGGLCKSGKIKTIALPNLALEDVRKMVQAILGQPNTPPNLVEQVYQESEGVPLFVKEILVYMAQEAILQFKRGFWQMKSSHSSGTLQGFSAGSDPTPRPTVPQNIRSLLEKRLLRLDEDVLKVVRTAAVIDKVFPIQLLVKVLDIPEEEVLDALDGLTKVQVLSPLDNGESYEFTHKKIREILLETMNAARKTKLHMRIAEEAEKFYENKLDDYHLFLAEHFRAGNLNSRAWPYFEKAADTAVERFDTPLGQQCYLLALDMVNGLTTEGFPDLHQVLARLCGKIGVLDYNQGKAFEAEERFLRGLREAELGGCVREEIEANLYLGMIAEESQHIEKGLAYFKKALAGAARTRDRRLEASILGKMGNHLIRHKYFEAAESALQQALTSLAKSKEHGPEARYYALLAESALARNDLEKAGEFYEAALKAGEAYGFQDNEEQMREAAAHIFIGLGRLELAETALAPILLKSGSPNTPQTPAK